MITHLSVKFNARSLRFVQFFRLTDMLSKVYNPFLVDFALVLFLLRSISVVFTNDTPGVLLLLTTNSFGICQCMRTHHLHTRVRMHCHATQIIYIQYMHTTSSSLECCGDRMLGDEERGRDPAFCTRGYFIQNDDSG